LVAIGKYSQLPHLREQCLQPQLPCCYCLLKPIPLASRSRHARSCQCRFSIPGLESPLPIGNLPFLVQAFRSIFSSLVERPHGLRRLRLSPLLLPRLLG
jgi:hypothetical protein